MKDLTVEQAYRAMFLYLEELYNNTHSGDLAGFLGGMVLASDGKTMDPAAWNDWIRAVNKILEEKK